MTRGRSQGGFCVFFRSSPAGNGALIQSLQITAYISCVLIALLSILVESPVDDFFKPRRDIGIYISRWDRGPRQNGFNNLAARAAAKSLARCRHFIQQQTEREDIRARVQIVSADQLG